MKVTKSIIIRFIFAESCFLFFLFPFYFLLIFGIFSKFRVFTSKTFHHEKFVILQFTLLFNIYYLLFTSIYYLLFNNLCRYIKWIHKANPPNVLHDVSKRPEKQPIKVFVSGNCLYLTNGWFKEKIFFRKR